MPILLQASNSSPIGGIVLIILAVALYFLPTIIGWNKRNSMSILLLNFFLGFTVIGWIVALIWAVAKDTQPVIINNSAVSTDSEVEKLSRFKRLLDDGVISQEEFDKKKSEILNN